MNHLISMLAMAAAMNTFQGAPKTYRIKKVKDPVHSDAYTRDPASISHRKDTKRRKRARKNKRGY